MSTAVYSLSLLLRTAYRPAYHRVSMCRLSVSCCHFYENDDMYKPSSPYWQKSPVRYGYDKKLWDGGLLPRSKDETPLPLPEYKGQSAWTKEKAKFGQNDYIDILGDGTVEPRDLIKGPPWLRGYKGHEFNRLRRQLIFKGEQLKETEPTEHFRIVKQMRYLYKKLNRRRTIRS